PPSERCLMDQRSIPQNGPPVQVGGRALSHIRNLANGRRDAELAALHTSGAAIVPTLGQLATLGGSTSARVAKALNGQKPKRPRPAQQTLASLGVLLKDAENLVHSPCWWNADYRASELAHLDRRLADWFRAHPDFEEWRDAWPAAVATAVNVLWALIATMIED